MLFTPGWGHGCRYNFLSLHLKAVLFGNQNVFSKQLNSVWAFTWRSFSKGRQKEDTFVFLLPGRQKCLPGFCQEDTFCCDPATKSVFLAKTWMALCCQDSKLIESTICCGQNVWKTSKWLWASAKLIPTSTCYTAACQRSLVWFMHHTYLIE